MATIMIFFLMDIHSFCIHLKAEDASCRMWMLRDDCLDEAISKLTDLLAAKDMCTASNAALVLARYIPFFKVHCNGKV